MKKLLLAAAIALVASACTMPALPFVNVAAPAPTVAARVAPAPATVVYATATLDRAKAALDPAPVASPAFPTLPQAAPAGPTELHATINVPASPAPTFQLPAGDWFQGALTFVLALLGGSAGIAGLIYPLLPVGTRIVAQMILPGLIDRAIGYASNAIPGVQSGQTLSVPVGNAVLAAAGQFAVDHLPTILLKAVGGADGLKAHIYAKLPLPTESGATDFGVKPPPIDIAVALQEAAASAVEAVTEAVTPSVTPPAPAVG